MKDTMKKGSQHGSQVWRRFYGRDGSGREWLGWMARSCSICALSCHAFCESQTKKSRLMRVHLPLLGVQLSLLQKACGQHQQRRSLVRPPERFGGSARHAGM